MMEKIKIRRQWNSFNIAEVLLEYLDNLHWDTYSGGVCAPAPQPFVHGYVDCTNVDGDLDHSCVHEQAPHRIKVCIVKKDNDKKVWEEILKIVGPKPPKS